MTNIGKPGTSHYQQNDGVRSDRAANQAFDKLGEIVDAAEATKFLQRIIDGGKLTDAEHETLNMARKSGRFTPAALKVLDIVERSMNAKEGWETRRANAKAELEKVLQAGEEQQALQTGTASMLQTRIEQKG